MGMDPSGVGAGKSLRSSAVRRPTIRPKAITPPRGTTTEESAVVPASGLSARGGWMLPPVRPPAVRRPIAPPRPVLQIVTDEESGDVRVPQSAESMPVALPAPAAGAAAWLAPPRVHWLIAAGVAVLLLAIAFVLIAASGRADASRVSSATTLSAERATAVSTSTIPSTPADPGAVPVFDVNSLPAAATQGASRASR